MRVAIWFPPGHPEHGDPDNEQPVVASYVLGRIEPGVHNAPLGHAEIPFEEFVQDLLARAKAEYEPTGAIVRLERLIDNGDGTARWIASDAFDPAEHTPQGAGNIKAQEVHATNGQQTGADA